MSAKQSAMIDITDIPAVAGDDLELIMRHLIASGRGLALVKGLTDDEWSEIDTLIWSYDWNAQRRLAVSVRFRSLITAFGARRLKALVMQRGFAVLHASMSVAAGLRLNARFGFSPQSLLLGMQAMLDRETFVTPVSSNQVAFAAAA